MKAKLESSKWLYVDNCPRCVTAKAQWNYKIAVEDGDDDWAGTAASSLIRGSAAEMSVSAAVISVRAEVIHGSVVVIHGWAAVPVIGVRRSAAGPCGVAGDSDDSSVAVPPQSSDALPLDGRRSGGDCGSESAREGRVVAAASWSDVVAVEWHSLIWRSSDDSWPNGTSQKRQRYAPPGVTARSRSYGRAPAEWPTTRARPPWVFMCRVSLLDCAHA